MSRVITPDVSNITMQELNDAGLNPFAVQLLVESYASPKNDLPLLPVTFVWRGVKVSLEVYVSPASAPKEGG